jgi:cytochrome c oxidase subunit 1
MGLPDVIRRMDITSIRTALSDSDQKETSAVGRAVIAGVAGFVGTLAMSPVLLVAWVLGVLDAAAFAGLAEIVGLGSSTLLGGLIFLGGGATTLPLLFVSLALFFPGETLARRGVVHASIIWTGFAIAFYTGQSGVALVLYLVLTYAAHVVYGAVLGYVYGRLATIPIYEI